MAKLALFLGIFLFIKVVFEDLRDGVSGIWSVDMRERVVREKIGSGLVIGSMILQLNSPVGRGRKQKSAKYFEYGNDEKFKNLLQSILCDIPMKSWY